MTGRVSVILGFTPSKRRFDTVGESKPCAFGDSIFSGLSRHIRKDRKGSYRMEGKMFSRFTQRLFSRFTQRLNWLTVAGITFFGIAWGRILEDYFPTNNFWGNILVAGIGVGFMFAGAYRSARERQRRRDSE